MICELPMDLKSLRDAYASGIQPVDIVREVYRRIEICKDPGIFITLRDIASVIKEAQSLGHFQVNKPLWGVPFCIKDNIDAAHLMTTAACPAFAYNADADAVCVARLRDAGALLIGKTNLDQFATGLVGIRSPYKVPRNALDPNIVPGGSSSGSAVAVAQGLVPFSLGTDTAGSGRVPAALNNIVGLKPTLGAISMTGVVPACRTLDTVSVFALTIEDAYTVTQTMAAYDATNAYSRTVAFPTLSPSPPALRIGIPSSDTLQFAGDRDQAAMFEAALKQIQALGGSCVEIDFAPFYEIAELLYSGSWIAERHVVTGHLLATNPDAVHPTTRSIIQKADQYSATDAFRDAYKLAELKLKVAPVLAEVDLLCVPSIPRFVSLNEIELDPVTPNLELGTYTNFVNLLDMCGLAVPTGPRLDGRPGSVTLLGAAGRDNLLAAFGHALQRALPCKLGATNWTLPDTGSVAQPYLSKDDIELVVVGAHMSGLPLNGELTRLGARFVRATFTASTYRLFALPGGPPLRPALVRSANGSAIAIETWALPRNRLGDFIAGIPQPLGIGTVILETGEHVKGFICEAAVLEGAIDVTDFGGWRAYLAQQSV